MEKRQARVAAPGITLKSKIREFENVVPGDKKFRQWPPSTGIQISKVEIQEGGKEQISDCMLLKYSI